MTDKLYQPVWDKFLPVIAMKLKSALRKQESEFLVMDQLDFEKASQRKRLSYQFHLELNEGRVVKSKNTTAVGIDFARALKDYPPVFELLKMGVFIFAFNNKYVLSLMPKFKVAEPVASQPSETQPE
jgi:hypothetical protein